MGDEEMQIQSLEMGKEEGCAAGLFDVPWESQTTISKKWCDARRATHRVANGQPVLKCNDRAFVLSNSGTMLSENFLFT